MFGGINLNIFLPNHNCLSFISCICLLQKKLIIYYCWQYSLHCHIRPMRTAAFLRAHLHHLLPTAQVETDCQGTTNHSFSAWTELPSSFPSALALLFGNAFHVLIESSRPLPAGELPLLSVLVVKEKEVRNDKFYTLYRIMCVYNTLKTHFWGLQVTKNLFR